MQRYESWRSIYTVFTGLAGGANEAPTIKEENKSFTVGDTRRERIFTVQEHLCSFAREKEERVAPFSSYKIYHAARLRSSTVRSFLLPFPRVYFIARNIRFRSTSCKHGRHLRPGISDDICSFFMSLWHSFREISYSLRARARARETPRRAVYGAVASSGSREIINIGSYERARSCGENNAGTSPTCNSQSLSSKLLFLAVTSKGMTYAFDLAAGVTMTHFYNGLIYQSVLSNLHVSRKNSEMCAYMVYAFARPICSRQEWKIIRVSKRFVLRRESSSRWYLKISRSFKCRKYCFTHCSTANVFIVLALVTFALPVRD